MYQFHKGLFTHSTVKRGDTQVQRQHGDHISLLLFSLNKENGLEKHAKLRGKNFCLIFSPLFICPVCNSERSVYIFEHLVFVSRV
jgi:hypothetical protein